jgi:hypothetical protein
MQTMNHGPSKHFSAIAAWLYLAPFAFAREPLSMPNSLAPGFTTVHNIANLSLFLIWITGGILLLVGGPLVFEPLRFRARKSDPLSGESLGPITEMISLAGILYRPIGRENGFWQ